MVWIEPLIIKEVRRVPTVDTRIAEQIDEEVESLAERYRVRVEDVRDLPYMMEFNLSGDCICYNPDMIRVIYGMLSRQYHVRLTDLVKHVFGCELGSRRKYKELIGHRLEEARRIQKYLTILYLRLEVVESILPEGMRAQIPSYRACAATHLLFEEYYAVEKSPLRMQSIERVEDAIITNYLRKHLGDAQRTLRTLSQANYEKIECYFIIPLVYLSTPALRVFPDPEYSVLQKIRAFLHQKIITARDVFDLNKIAHVADTIMCELEGISEFLPEDVRVKNLERDLRSVISMLHRRLGECCC